MEGFRELHNNTLPKKHDSQNNTPFNIIPLTHVSDGLYIECPPRDFGSGRKFPHGRLGKKMPSTEIPNEMVVYSATSSDDEKIGCTQAEKHAIEATMKGKLVHNTLIEMVANETIQEPLLLQATKGGD
jgi:hypothetical protein